MPSYNTWFGPFILNKSAIQTKIDSDGPGVFLLGTMDSLGQLHIKKVESSNNIQKDLKQWIGVWDIFLYERVQNDIQAAMDQHAISEYFHVGENSARDKRDMRLLDRLKEGWGSSSLESAN
jgi:hypothetical protein